MKKIDPILLRRTLGFINTYQQKNGESPSFRVIMTRLGFTSLSVVSRYIEKLEDSGLVRKTSEGKIETNEKFRKKNCISAPLLGVVHCGEPGFAVENIEAVYSLPGELFGETESDLFLLKATGDSMIEAGIFDSDFLVIKKQDYAAYGDIVLAIVNGEDATVKRYMPADGKIILHPENKEMSDIVVTDCIIQGIVISNIHRLKN